MPPPTPDRSRRARLDQTDTQPAPTSSTTPVAARPLPAPPSRRPSAPAPPRRAPPTSASTPPRRRPARPSARYLQNLRNGELGSLPALLGLLALFVLFTVLDSGGTFPSLLNLANLLQQGAGQTVIAMGLVFVLLIGEIDLAAGTASGLAAAVLALHQVSNGNLLGAMGTTVFVAFVAIMALAVALAVWLRIWVGAAFGGLGLVLMLVGFPPNAWLEMLLAVCVGVVIGVLTGFMVAKLGMPSFVVTLALFISWQGVILQLIGDGGTLGLREPGARRRRQRQHVDRRQLAAVPRGRRRLRGRAAEPSVPPAQARARRPAHRPGADQDRRRWCCSRRCSPSCSPSTARRARSASPACPTSCRSCW